VTLEAQAPTAFRGMKRQVIKHSSAIQIGTSDGDITLVQRKCFNVLLAHAYDDLLNKTTHKIPLGDLCRYLNFDSNNTKHLKDALRGLVKANVEWNILGADRKQQWGVAALLSEVQIKNGFCYWEYTSTMRRMLYSPTVYLRINLSLQNKFSSKHALTLYENIYFYYRKDDGFGETPWIEIEVLRKLLSIKESEYKQFKSLNNIVIKNAIAEINNKTDLQVDVEYKRNGRKVGAVKFCVKLSQTEETAPPILADANTLSQQLIKNYGISAKQAQQLIEKYDAVHIAENLAIVDQDVKENKVKGNLAGYAMTAIKNDFRKDRKPVAKAIPIYEGMRLLYQGKEYILDSSLSIRLESGTLPTGAIIEKIKAGVIRVLELLLFPGIKLIIDGQVRTIKNALGEPVVKEDGLYLSEKELIEGIKSRKYTILEYPEEILEIE
jgi:plasmid replication initiation protein